jgi:hypothetical protein
MGQQRVSSTHGKNKVINEKTPLARLLQEFNQIK